MYYISLPLPLVTVARWHKYKVVHVRKLAKIWEAREAVPFLYYFVTVADCHKEATDSLLL